MAKGHGANPRHEEHEEHEEHVNHEAWVIPYADMLTLLMALFLVLFAIGRTDAAKAKLAAESFKSQLNGSAQIVSIGGVGDRPIVGGNGVLDNAGAAVPTTGLTSAIVPIQVGPAGLPAAVTAVDGPSATTPADRALAEQQVAVQAAQDSAASLAAVQQLLEAETTASGISNEVYFDLQARGLVLTIVTDTVLFDPGRADLQPGGVQILDLVADALTTIPNDIAIEGHTDSKPISTSQFPSNWELSTARATSVLRYLIDAHHLDPTRLSASGYSDTRPIDDNSTVAGEARNRRVEIVILSSVSLAPILPGG